MQTWILGSTSTTLTQTLSFSLNMHHPLNVSLVIHHSCSTVNTINPSNCVMLTLGFEHFLTDCR